MRTSGHLSIDLPSSAGIDAQEDKQQNGEAPQGGATVAEKRKGNTNDGHQPQHHAYINGEMKEEETRHAVTVDAPEDGGLALGNVQKPQQ